MVLGYLLIHTRQVDMVMDEEGFVGRYLDKIHADIRTIREQLIKETRGHDAVERPRNILLIDDEEDFLETTSRRLAGAGSSR
ncbi:MAG: hypothetical protein MZV65_18050 [Chromatiales bacterium]|nr:hypothetical protein [Chromatiales bacterium]